MAGPDRPLMGRDRLSASQDRPVAGPDGRLGAGQEGSAAGDPASVSSMPRESQAPTVGRQTTSASVDAEGDGVTATSEKKKYADDDDDFDLELEEQEERIPDWIRSSPADVYFRRDKAVSGSLLL